MNLRALNLTFCFSLVSLFFLSGCVENSPQVTVSVDQILKVDNTIKLKSSGELYSGYLVDHYQSSETNTLKSRSLVKGGKLNGLSEGWYSGGQLQISETFIEGRSHGVRVKWYSNGQKEAEDSIEHGELHGSCRKWHDNGLLSEEMTMVKGKADGRARSWHKDGSLKAEVLLEMGEVVNQKFWGLGEKIQNSNALTDNDKGGES